MGERQTAGSGWGKQAAVGPGEKLRKCKKNFVRVVREVGGGCQERLGHLLPQGEIHCSEEEPSPFLVK